MEAKVNKNKLKGTNKYDSFIQLEINHAKTNYKWLKV